MNGSVCIENECVCQPDHVLIDGICVARIFVRRCITSQQCPSGAHCVNGVCSCTLGTAMSRYGFCIPISSESGPGMTCENGETCTGYSTCVRGICTCPTGRSYIVNNECVKTLRGQLQHLRRVTDPRKRWRPLEECPAANSCHLPNCFCSRSGLEIPGGLIPIDVPQMILLTFDGPITDSVFAIYKYLFDGKYRNPNGCPIKATFFVSHEGNNYDETQWLLSVGHEVAISSISNQNLSNETLERWKKEMVGMREALRHFSYANVADIMGVRAPQLELGGDNQFDIMETSGLLFDNTMSASGGPYWPQTLAYKTAWRCLSKNCPKRAHPYIWEIPINRFTTLNSDEEFTMLREAIRPDDSPTDVAEMLELNFNRSYKYHRTPYLLTIDNDFLNALPNRGAVTALEFFIEKALSNSDTYFVTVTQALRWIKQPTRLLNIHNFQSWQCNAQHRSSIRPCESSSSCSYTCDGEARVLRICGICPRVYPKLGDPTGTGNSTTD